MQADEQLVRTTSCVVLRCGRHLHVNDVRQRPLAMLVDEATRGAQAAASTKLRSSSKKAHPFSMALHCTLTLRSHFTVRAKVWIQHKNLEISPSTSNQNY
eukprot:6445688-Amphidinium_carterae.1